MRSADFNLVSLRSAAAKKAFSNLRASKFVPCKFASENQQLKDFISQNLEWVLFIILSYINSY